MACNLQQRYCIFTSCNGFFVKTSSYFPQQQASPSQDFYLYNSPKKQPNTTTTSTSYNSNPHATAQLFQGTQYFGTSPSMYSQQQQQQQHIASYPTTPDHHQLQPPASPQSIQSPYRYVQSFFIQELLRQALLTRNGLIYQQLDPNSTHFAKIIHLCR